MKNTKHSLETRSVTNQEVPPLCPDVPESRGNSLEAFREISSQRQVVQLVRKAAAKLQRKQEANRKEKIKKLLETKARIEQELKALIAAESNQSTTKKKRHKIAKETKICLVCKKEYQGTQNQKYCSASCKSTIVYAKSTFAELRFKVLRRDGFTCQYCGKKPKDGAVLHVDHITPKAKGGEDVIGNLITSCKECNLAKNDRPFSRELEARIKEEISCG